MQIKPDEITDILKKRIEGLDEGGAELTEVGTVLSIGDGIARVHGLENCMSFETLELPHDVTGLALNLEADNVGAVLFGEWDKIVEGDTAKRTGELLDGDRQIGKTAIAVDTIINNRDSDLVSIYVAVGQRMSTVVGLAETLAEAGAMERSIIVAAGADEAAPIKFLAPYAA